MSGDEKNKKGVCHPNMSFAAMLPRNKIIGINKTMIADNVSSLVAISTRIRG